MLIHREYGARHDASFTIWSNHVETRNWNIPFGYGMITLGNLRPHAKNPTIANFFAQLGFVEELGNGTRTLFKYVPLISNGAAPVIEEGDEFIVNIPYIQEEEKSKKKSKEKKNKTTSKILNLISKNTKITTTELAAETGLTHGGIYKALRKLRTDGLLVRRGGRKGGYWEIIQILTKQ